MERQADKKRWRREVERDRYAQGGRKPEASTVVDESVSTRRE